MQGEVGIEQTHRNAELCTSVSRIHKLCLSRCLNSTLQPAYLGRMVALHVGRHYDSTPAYVAFGHLTERVAPHSRYFVTDEVTGKWKTIGLDEWMGLGRLLCKPFGLVDARFNVIVATVGGR